MLATHNAMRYKVCIAQAIAQAHKQQSVNNMQSNNTVAQHTVTFSATLNCTHAQAVALFNALNEAHAQMIDIDETVYDNEDSPASVYVLDADGTTVY